MLSIIEQTTDADGDFLLFNGCWFMLYSNRKEPLTKWLKTLAMNDVVEINEIGDAIIFSVVGSASEQHKITDLDRGMEQ
jgi:hypothetical protein